MSMKSRAAIVIAKARSGGAALLIGTFLLLAGAPGPARAAETVTIEISNYSFMPSEVAVAPGTMVVWVNHDQSPHTIISSDHLFGSKAMDTDDRYSFVFDKEGDYSYVCSLHPYMAGIIKVRRP
jgi:plastocyanin